MCSMLGAAAMVVYPYALETSSGVCCRQAKLCWVMAKDLQSNPKRELLLLSFVASQILLVPRNY